MNIPNPTEKQESLGRFWWTVAPFYRSYKPDEDGGEHDIPAIIAEAQRLERDRIKKIVEDICNENGVLCTRDNLLARIDQDKPKS